MAGRIRTGRHRASSRLGRGWLSGEPVLHPARRAARSACHRQRNAHRAVREGIAVDDLAGVKQALVVRLSPGWVGAVGGAVLMRDQRPMVSGFARVRRASGQVWVRSGSGWLGSNGGVPDEVWQGKIGALPGWLAPLAPDWPASDTPHTTEVVDGAHFELETRPGHRTAGNRLDVPEGARAEMVELAAGVLAERFAETALPTPPWSSGATENSARGLGPVPVAPASCTGATSGP